MDNTIIADIDFGGETKSVLIEYRAHVRCYGNEPFLSVDTLRAWLVSAEGEKIRELTYKEYENWRLEDELVLAIIRERENVGES